MQIIAPALGLALALSGCAGTQQGVPKDTGILSPPDVSVAAGLHGAIESTNGNALAAYSTGSNEVAVVPGGPIDGRVYFELLDDRYVTTAMTSDHLTVNVSVSPIEDPTLPGWRTYQYFYAGMVDQPTLGLGYVNTILVQRNAGQGIFVEDTGALLGGGTLSTTVIPMAGDKGYAAHHGDGIGDRNFIVSSGSGGVNYFIQRVNGDRSVEQTAVAVNHALAYTIRNGPYSLVSPVTPDPQDVLIARGAHHLYIVSTVGMNGGLCQRVVDLYDLQSSPFTLTNQGGTTFCLAGSDVYYGSLGQTWSGDVYLAANCSGPSLPISLCWAHWSGPQAAVQQVGIKKQGTSYLNDRIGDYTGTTIAWYTNGAELLIGGQVQMGQPYWQTWLDQIP